MEEKFIIFAEIFTNHNIAKMDFQDTSLTFLRLFGALALLLYAVKMMGENLQKIAGEQLRGILQIASNNRFVNMFKGLIVTAWVQSSTATTLMTVSFVNAGMLTLAQAIAMIMGSNIGATITAWIICAGMCCNPEYFIWAVFIVAVMLIYVKRTKILADLLMGIAFLVLATTALEFTSSALTPEAFPALDSLIISHENYLSYLLYIIAGCFLTFFVKSSAMVIALTMTLCMTGMLPASLGCATILGINIGTTITTNVVAMKTNTQAQRAAFAHLTFNVAGAVLALIVFRPFVNATCAVCGVDPSDTSSEALKMMPVVLALFHTAFNTLSAVIQIWAIPLIERFVCNVIKHDPGDEGDDNKLHFIAGGILATPELSVLEAKKEIHLYGERTRRMFGMVIDLINEHDTERAKNLLERVKKYEDISDNMEIEIAKYLEAVSDNHVSDETKSKIRGMLREISELETIGDSCFHIARTISRRTLNNEEFSDRQASRINQMFNLVNDSLVQMNILLDERKTNVDINHSYTIENEINNYQKQLANQNITDVNNHVYAYAVGTIFMDIINECEEIGNAAVNVVEAVTGGKKRTV